MCTLYFAYLWNINEIKSSYWYTGLEEIILFSCLRILEKNRTNLELGKEQDSEAWHQNLHLGNFCLKFYLLHYKIVSISLSEHTL